MAVAFDLLRSPGSWAGTYPAVLVGPDADAAGRRMLLRRFAARCLGRPPRTVSILHAAGAPPRLTEPAGSGLHLSSASRDGVAVLAIDRAPVGIDIEGVSDAEPPWNVLHPDEASACRAMRHEDRPAAFARIWSVKEAYYKATGGRFAREPDGFEVVLNDPDTATVLDGERRIAARTALLREGGADYVVALVRDAL